MAKPVIKFKTYRQSVRVGGKIYGVPNLGDPVVASVTMQEVIDYAKLHNYSADTLEALLSQVIAGVGALVARDGRPRMLSDLLKFEPVIKGTFENLEQTVTNQKVLVRPRLLKEIRVKLDPSAYSWMNENDTSSPRLYSVAPASDDFSTVDLESVRAAFDLTAPFGWTYAGQRLCPNGWDENCTFDVLYRPGVTPVTGVDEFHLTVNNAGGDRFGIYQHVAADEATDNAVALSCQANAVAQAWYMADSEVQGVTITPERGDIIEFRFTRTLDNGDRFTVSKTYTL